MTLSVPMRWTLSAVAILAAAAILTASVMSSQDANSTATKSRQDKPAKTDKAKDKEAAAQTPAAPLTSEQLAALSTPGEAHGKLAIFEGTWNQVVTIHDPTGASEPMQTTASATYTPILGGRFMMGHYTGPGMQGGQPFEAYDIIGYDAFRSEYTSIWLTNQSTTATHYSGDINKAGSLISMNGKNDDTMTGNQSQPIKTKTRFIDENTIEFETHGKGADGKFVLVVQVKATRATQ